MTGSEDGTIKIYDVRIPGIQRDYTPDPKSPINGVIIHPNQGICFAKITPSKTLSSGLPASPLKVNLFHAIKMALLEYGTWVKIAVRTSCCQMKIPL